MSLSPEALAQLEELDLQEAKDGFNFVVPTESGRPTLTDLSADEMNGFRAWDLSGVLAGLNSLTFEKMHPELVAVPDETAAPVPDAEGELPDWLKADESWSRENFSLEEPVVPSGPTEEEARAGLQAAGVVGNGTQALHNEEVVILPAEKKSEAEVEAEAKRGLAKWLKKIDFGKLAKEGARYLIPPLTGLTLGRFLSPEQALNLTQTAIAVGMLGFIGSGGCAVAEKVVSGHPRVAGLARLFAAGRVTGAIFAETGMLMAAGSFAGGLLHEREIVRQAAAQLSQPAVTGGGESPVGPTIRAPVHGGVPDANLPQPSAAGGGLAGGQSPVLSPGTSELVNRAGEVAAQEVREMAEAAQGAVAQAAAQAAEVARIAALQQGPTVAELAANMPKHTISEAIYQMIGNVPHRGEVTNVLFRAIGDKVNSLNEGAIKAAAQALRPVFDNIDKVVTGSGATYTEGGRAAVEAMRGFNSPEAQAIRAANMADLEAASNLLNNVIGPVIK